MSYDSIKAEQETDAFDDHDFAHAEHADVTTTSDFDVTAPYTTNDYGDVAAPYPPVDDDQVTAPYPTFNATTVQSTSQELSAATRPTKKLKRTAEIVFKQVKQADLVSEIKPAATEPLSRQPIHLDVTDNQSRTHNIQYLAQLAKAREHELNRQFEVERVKKLQSRKRYGF